MGLVEEYSENIENISSSLENQFSRNRAHSLKKALDNVMPFVLLLIGFVVVFEFFLPVTHSMEIWIARANWALVAYFGARLIVSYRLSVDHERFLEDHWLDILLVIPVFSMIQEARILRMAPALREMPVFQRGIFHAAEMGSTTENATKLTRITRIIKRSA